MGPAANIATGNPNTSKAASPSITLRVQTALI
eukprot:CAMPEP_0184496880 /NCGR_PEP_ID=MMETSP0113_2-20130426/35118_1 /TAXON_ID=91329 /ORGANISM="Norrisiella sphaerica, Strain BC52" /LENGTH=31 /DNA_ID= /DNA_START= /DNA_END= /DNA_ORIENTATION=